MKESERGGGSERERGGREGEERERETNRQLESPNTDESLHM